MRGAYRAVLRAPTRARTEFSGARDATRLAARTPADRDRHLDLLRVFSPGTVIAGHWLMAVLLVGRDGGVTTDNAGARAGVPGPARTGRPGAAGKAG